MGSRSDAGLVQPCLDMLRELGIPFEVRVLSAHRQPEEVREYGLLARDRGLEVLIGAAGMAGHLPGVMASWTILPVIGLPLATSELSGMDSLLSVVQMPSGVPVATVAIGGAKNAAYLAVQILALSDGRLAEALTRHKQEMAEAVKAKDSKLQG